jgi:hypothetical protein
MQTARLRQRMAKILMKRNSSNEPFDLQGRKIYENHRQNFRIYDLSPVDL